MKWKTAHQAVESLVGCQIPGDPVFKTRSQNSWCSHAYWMLAFRRGTVFQHKYFTLSKIQIRGGSLNTSKNVKHYNRKFFSEVLQQVTSQTWSTSVRTRGLPGDRFFSICPLESFYTFLRCLHWRQGRMWLYAYLVTFTDLVTWRYLCHGAHKAPLSGLCTLVGWVSELGRQYSESHQEGKMLCASPSAGIKYDWYSVPTPWRAAYAEVDGSIILVDGSYKQGYVQKWRGSETR